MKAIRLIGLLVFLLPACGGRETLAEPQAKGYEAAKSDDEEVARDALKKIQDEIAAAEAALEKLQSEKPSNPTDNKAIEEAAAKEKALQEEIDRKKRELLPYELQFKFSQKCLEIDGGRLDDDARAIQLPCIKSNVQKFRLLQKATGLQIQNMVTGKCLVAFQAGTGNGTPVTQATCADIDTQLFEKIADGAGFFYLKNKSSTRCLQIETNQPTDRLGVELFDCLQNDNQKIRMTQDAG